MSEALDEIERLLETLEGEIDEQRDLGEKAAVAQAKYKSLRGKEMLASKVNPDLKTVSDREAWVDDRLENEYLDMRKAEALLDAQKERTRTLRAMLSALQTLNSAGRV